MDTRGRSLLRTALKRRKRREQAVLSVGAPQRTGENLDERMSDCAHYKACLTYAIHKGWENFSCLDCADYRRSTVELEQAAMGIRVSLAGDRKS
jgi:hypothetical protein